MNRDSVRVVHENPVRSDEQREEEKNPILGTRESTGEGGSKNPPK